jgi:hypothetical protein
MYWLENYIKDNLFYDVILRSPFEIKSNMVRSCMHDCNGKLEISLSSSKVKEDILLNLSSIFSEFSRGNKVKVFKKKGFSGKKVYRLSVILQKSSTIYFLDFFLNMIVKGLKRRFIILRSSLSNTGVLNMRFSSLSELEIDDFLFFEVDSWQGSLSIFLTFSNNYYISYMANLYFLNIFNLKKLVKYEISIGKG